MSATAASVQAHQRADQEVSLKEGNGHVDEEDSSGEVLLCSQPGAVKPSSLPASQPASQQGDARRGAPASLPSGRDAIRAAVARRLQQASSQTAEVCEDCGRARPTYKDCTDNRKYCHDCWLSFYGEPPLSAAPVKPSPFTAPVKPSPFTAPVKPALSVAPVKPKSIGIADMQRSGLTTAEVDASVLPEDAPRGHPAHIACRFLAHHKNPLVSFRWKGNGIDLPFQTTVFTSGGSVHAAEVIARACYMKFEQGWSKDQVLKFRQACYERIRLAGYTGVKQVHGSCPRPRPVQPSAPKQVCSPVQPQVQQAEPQRLRCSTAASNISQKLRIREDPHCTAPSSQIAISSKRMPVVGTAPSSQIAMSSKRMPVVVRLLQLHIPAKELGLTLDQALCLQTTCETY